MAGDPIIYGFGSAAIDFRIQTAEMGAEYTEKLLAQKVDVLPGGSVANCLAQISSLGGKTSWLGKLGCDWIGDRIIEQLKADGIDADGVIRDKNLCSPFNLAAYAGDSRRRVGGWLLPNSLADITDNDIANWTNLVRPSDWLMLEIGEIPLDISIKVCRMFKSKNAKIAIDIDLDPVDQCRANHNDIESIFSLADLLIPNVTAMKNLFGKLSPEELAKTMYEKYDATTVVTAGDKGAWACGEKGLIHQPAIPTEVVDTVGAGDAFHGGLVWAMSQGKPLAESLKLSAECGAKACTKKGAR